MNKYMTMIMMVFLLLSMTAVSAQTLNLEARTDKDWYITGETVSWSIYAWTDSTNNRGIANLTVNLDDSTVDTLNIADTTGSILMVDLELADTDFGIANKFKMMMPGTLSGSTPQLVDIMAGQLPNDKQLYIASDGIPHLFCKGSYVVTTLGTHDLEVEFNSANYYHMSSPYAAVPFTLHFETNKTFEVYPEPSVCGDMGTVYLDSDINEDCYVNLLDYSIMAHYWLTTCIAPEFCRGADIAGSDDYIDINDLAQLASQWLNCTDPAESACDIYW